MISGTSQNVIRKFWHFMDGELFAIFYEYERVPNQDGMMAGTGWTHEGDKILTNCYSYMESME
jgi:hypothetical protein